MYFVSLSTHSDLEILALVRYTTIEKHAYGEYFRWLFHGYLTRSLQLNMRRSTVLST